MKKNKTNKATALIFSLGIIFITSAFSVYASMTYTPMEEIPGFGKSGDFPTYLMSIYKFGLWAIGICALLMITIGGYMYIGSAGNKSTAERAKKIIYDALAGIILAMVSWLLLYLINPDLLRSNPLNTSSNTSTPAASTPVVAPKNTPGSTATAPGWYYTWFNWVVAASSIVSNYSTSGEYGPFQTKEACEAGRKNVYVNVSANYACYEKTAQNISSDNTQKGCCIFKCNSKNKCRKDCTQRICDTLPGCTFQLNSNNCDNCTTEAGCT